MNIGAAAGMMTFAETTSHIMARTKTHVTMQPAATLIRRALARLALPCSLGGSRGPGGLGSLWGGLGGMSDTKGNQ
jgi:hypothetical protein